MPPLIEYRTERDPGPDIPAHPEEERLTAPEHPLDGEHGQRVLGALQAWWDEARELHADNRRQQYIDADYRDGMQWRPDDAAILIERGQMPLGYPLIKQMRDWITGTERRTRIDWNVLPRNEDDVETAPIKTALMKYISDVNGISFERSRVFDDAVDVGVGWMEVCYSRDQADEPITGSHTDWKCIWWDPYSRKNDLSDCRYIHRAKFTDLDYAIAMFPDRADKLRAAAVNTMDPETEVMDMDMAVPMMFFSTTSEPSPSPNTPGSYVLRHGGAGHHFGRQRVLLVETWYRQPKPIQIMSGDPDLDGQRFDPNNPEHVELKESGAVSLVDSVTEEVRVAFWTPGHLLKEQASPYRHNRFPFVPCWGYRRHRDGMPYGVIRLTRDAQDEYNKRRSKALFLLSTCKVEYEVGAFEQGDEEEMLEEYARPDGRIRLANGALSNSKVRVTHNQALAQSEIDLMQEAKSNIYEVSGVTRENTGQDTNASSGRAILAKQQQGAVTTAELFDNFRRFIQLSGQTMLSVMEQFITMPKVFRIVGPNGAAQWERVNQIRITDEGLAVFENDITRHAADFVVDEMDYRETHRMALAEQLFDLLSKIDPGVALQLLDAAIELTDIPNKRLLAARVRAITGVPEPGHEDSEEAQAAKAIREQAEQEEAALSKKERLAKLMVDTAKAMSERVEARSKAFDLAAKLAAAPVLAGAADALTEDNLGEAPTTEPTQEEAAPQADQ